MGYVPIHFRNTPPQNLQREVEESDSYEQGSTEDIKEATENNFIQEYQPLGPLPASHNYAVPYHAHIDDSSYI